MYWPEKYQVGIVSHYLYEEGIDFVTEASLYSIPVDILGYDGDDTYAIELKTRDFSRGIRQAERNLLYTDYSYLSVWEENVTENLIERIDDSSVGLLSIAENTECLSLPRRNTPSQHARKRVIEKVLNDDRKQRTLSS